MIEKYEKTPLTHPKPVTLRECERSDRLPSRKKALVPRMINILSSG